VNFEWEPINSRWKGRDRRKADRIKSNQAVRILLPSREVTMHGNLVDLSETGCCVDPLEPFLVWNEIRVEIRFEASQMQFRLAGVTRGSRGGKKFGIEFDSMTAEKLEALKLLLPTPREPDIKIDAVVALTEPDEVEAVAVSDEEAAEESFNQTMGRPPRNGKLFGLVRMEKPPGGRERRVHSRYIVDAQAVLLVVKSGEVISGFVLEVSQSGCRVYLDEPFQYGIGIHLEVNFTVHGIPVRMAGVSQVQIDHRTVGIRFLDLSGRKQTQLNELITEIKEAMAAPGYSE
jgi:c-di-GMP-binding flagellar brake protein YcgR